MELTISRKLILILGLLVLAGVAAALLVTRLAGETLAQATGLDTGRAAALAGVEAFYSVDYQSGPEVWAARLCAVSSEPACEFYQGTAAYLWPEFETDRTSVQAKAGDAARLSEQVAATRGDAPMQLWQVGVALSAPWPQGDGRTHFPAHVLVVREADGWKFERFLLADEVALHEGGAQ